MTASVDALAAALADVLATAGAGPADDGWPPVLTVAQAAAYLQISERSVTRGIAAGSIPAARPAGTWRISRAALDRALAGDHLEHHE